VGVPLLLIINNLILALVMAAIFVAVGARLRRCAGLAVAPRLRLAVDFCAGAWAAATIVLLMGLAGATAALPLLAVLCALAAVGRWRRAGRRWRAVTWGVLGGGLSLPVAAGPPFFYDAMVYHLGLPWQALMEGGVRAHPENLFAAFPPLAQLLGLPPLACGLDRVPALLHWLSFVAAATAVAALARALGARPALAHAAALTCLVLPVAPLVPGFPAAEGWFLAALLTACAVLVAPHHRGAEVVVGLLLGVATAARLQGIGWTVLVLVLLVWRRRAWRPLATAAGAWVLGALPWWLKNAVLLHDPVAPVLWRREGLETLWRDAGALHLQGLSLVGCLQQLPARLGGEALVLVPLALMALAAGWREPRQRQLVVLALAAVPVWLVSGALARFLLPVIALLVAVAASSARSRATRVAAAVVVLWCAGIGAWRTVGLLRAVQPRSLLAVTTATATARLLPNDPQLAYRSAELLPADARVLLVAEPRGFAFPRAFTVTSQHDPSPLRSMWRQTTAAAEVRTCLRGQGFTHLLVNWAELDRLRASYPVAPWSTQAERTRWLELVAEMQPPVVRRGAVEIFDLGPP
jgi:hypothetical protein